MATEREMKKVLAPVLERFPDWRYCGRLLFCMPLGYYFRGIVFKGAWFDREVVEIWRCVCPMYEYGGTLPLNWGLPCPLSGATSHVLNVFHPGFADAVTETMQQMIVPIVAPVTRGSQFLRYQDSGYNNHGWPAWGRALAHIHIGDLDAAREFLIDDAREISNQSPPLQLGWGDNLFELLRLIEEEPEAIPAHCEAVARAAVKANKLEKFWEPQPFVYEKG